MSIPQSGGGPIERYEQMAEYLASGCKPKRIGGSEPSMKSSDFAKTVYYRCHTKANVPFMPCYPPCVTAMIGKSFAKVAN